MGPRTSRMVPTFVQLMIFQAMGSFCNSSYSPLSPFFHSSYRISQSDLGFINSMVFLGMSIISLISGLLIDRYGAKVLLWVSMCFFVAGGLIGGILHSYVAVLVSFLIIGFGYGIVTPATSRALMNAYAPRHSRYMGFKQTGVSIGGALAVLCTPLVATAFGLVGAFLLIALLGCLGAASLLLVQNWPFPAGASQSFQQKLVQVVKYPPLIFISIVIFFFIWVQQSILTFYVLSIRQLGIPLNLSETFLFVILVGAIVGRLLWASGSERLFHGDRARLLAMIGTVSGGMLFVLALGLTNFTVDLILSFFLGVTTQAWNGTYVTLVAEIVPLNLVGSASGTSLAFAYLGAIFGTPISGFVVDKTSSFGTLWVILGFSMLAVSFIIALFYGPIRKRSTVIG
ncbi:MFS transporter [Alicyclobacillus ferrooxydans]|uniref:Major facilitator superfamily (MFS) profile domain-containing protein n=1 Tax=Alicyclobacillus ferrooxydans TaxID=471514 RepID=A0A0P9CAH9_9BACL|nr:MFS transporter [Alicyclobacillus ferrooxydans]KPV42430.1 hypothetical protein AN477_17695 [Alicyclobacillus ferrooxydans]